METHELDLFDNAIDSLEESLSKFNEGEAGNQKAYKFAVIHMAHFVELIFKHHVVQINSLLIYKDPFARKIDKNKTINLWDAINFINNESSDAISDEFRSDLEWIRKLRNQIEHHKFSLDIQQTRITLGRLFRSILEFTNVVSDIDISDNISETSMDTFTLLSDEYEMIRRDAIKKADDYGEKNQPDYSSDPDAYPPRVTCTDCDNPTTIQDDDSETGYSCLLCGSEYSLEIPASCDICGLVSTIGDLYTWQEEDDSVRLRCYYCSGMHHMDRDD